MICSNCNKFPVPQPRVEIGLTTCMSCAQRVKPVRGTMIYLHKTSGFIEIHNADDWEEKRKYYVPQNRSCVKHFSKHTCS